MCRSSSNDQQYVRIQYKERHVSKTHSYLPTVHFAFVFQPNGIEFHSEDSLMLRVYMLIVTNEENHAINM
jgi:hypothetical protein